MNKSVGEKTIKSVYIVPGDPMVQIKGFVKERKRSVRIHICSNEEVKMIKHLIEQDTLIGMPLRNASKLLKQTMFNHYKMLKLIDGGST